MSEEIAVVVLGARSAGLARRVADALPGSLVHAPDCAACDADRRFAKATAHIAGLFAAGTPVVGICAAGILIRAVGPLLADKGREPPVVAVAEDASAVVPLLGGHRGANALAATIAAALDVRAALTTAGDLAFGVALDAPPPGWRLAEPALAKPLMARLLDGAPVRIEVEAGGRCWLDAAELPRQDDARLSILVTARDVPATPERMVVHPQVLALGVGCERNAPPEALAALVEATLAEAGLAAGAVACVVSLDLKAAEPAVHALAARLDRPARFFTADALKAETPRLANPSPTVLAATGTPGVAEAAALRAAGPEGRLVVPKRKGQGCTCAVALAPVPIDPEAVGRARGLLSVVGIGPGDPATRTPAVEARLRQADELVGYGLYLDLVADLGLRALRSAYPLGDETARCRHALERAAAGRRVALVCSGDAGIYAMAALVVELLASSDDPGWQRVEVEVLPGVSAFQAAAARVGGAIGHDFCCVSLSDLLTPWPVIERRLEAAAAGDFVLALYNPVSQRRRTALPAARQSLLRHRPAATPVVLARNLGRPEEQVRIVTLAELETDMVDMLTLVLVGNAASRLVPRLDGRDLVLTPRGYPVT
ncbi:MAG: precorrin-3B C(17)-methyltransferase [Geminicoccaceae bacterium]